MLRPGELFRSAFGFRELGSWPLRLTVLFFSLLLIARTLSRGDDFLVFYRAALGFWHGVSPYDQSVYGNMVFKYPPWVLPFFLPLAILPEVAAKIFWGLVQAYSLLHVVRVLNGRFAVEPRLQVLFLFSFFGLIGIHGMVGQVTLPLLALALSTDALTTSLPKFAGLATGFSAKLVTLFPFFTAFRRRDVFRAGIVVLLSWSALSLPILGYTYSFDGSRMVADWRSAMFSGTRAVNSVRIGFTTREAQGFPSLALRKLGLDETDSAQVLTCVLVVAALMAAFWFWRSRRLSLEDQWLGWIALTPVVQPLAWFHFYLFVYPVIVVGANRAWLRRDARAFVLLIAAAFLVGAITEKTFGHAGLALEMWSVKSWGTLLAVSVFSSGLEKKKAGGESPPAFLN